MTRPPLTLIAALLLSFVALPLTAGAESTTVASRAIVKVAFNKKLKKSILVDVRGRTLYMSTADGRDYPSCYDDPDTHCAKLWPPLLTTGAPRAGHGAKASLLGVAKRGSEGLQVTYNHHPLYTNSGAKDLGLVADKKPGDVHGQGFYHVWYVLSPKGTPIGY